jgi:hypothetical protein
VGFGEVICSTCSKYPASDDEVGERGGHDVSSSLRMQVKGIC